MRDTFLDNDALWLGLLWAIFVPVAGYAIIDSAYDAFSIPKMSDSVRYRSLMGICLNIIPMQVYNKWRYDRTVRGIVLATVGLAFVWFAFFYKQILANE
jgi:hypothetical protein